MKRANSAFSLIELSIVVLIIGIIIAGITQSSSLVRKMRLNTAKNLTTSSPVAGINDLVLWVESTSESSFDTSEQSEGSPLTNWYDLNPQSSFKNNFNQSSSSNKPTYKIEGINNLPSIYFDGTNDSMSSIESTNSSGYFNNNNFTIFVVTNFLTTTNSVSVLFQFLNQAGGQRNIGLELNNTDRLRLDGPNSTTALGTAAIGFDQARIISGFRNPSNTTLFVNGTQYASTTSTAQTSISGIFALGAYVSGSNYFSKAHIGEVIVYGRALTTEERKAVESYLSKKWSIKIS
jgi:prepilin-type N-terminal cleavage/methylation domain-containing protein